MWGRGWGVKRGGNEKWGGVGMGNGWVNGIDEEECVKERGEER